MKTATKKKSVNKTKLITPKFRACFVTLFEPRAMEEGKKPSYSVTMLFDRKTDLTPLRQAVKAAIAKKWGNKPPKMLRDPFRDAGEKSEEYEGFKKGMTFVTARSYDKPQVVDQDVDPIVDKKEVYSGCYCRASITAGAYDQAGNKGVAFYLNNVQKLADGEPLGGSSRAEDDFKPVGSDDDEDEDDTDDEDDDADESDEDEDADEDSDDEDEDEDSDDEDEDEEDEEEAPPPVKKKKVARR